MKKKELLWGKKNFVLDFSVITETTIPPFISLFRLKFNDNMQNLNGRYFTTRTYGMN